MAITRRPLLLVIGAVALLPRSAAAQQSVVTGRVTSDAGVPLTYADLPSGRAFAHRAHPRSSSP